ncbi:MAG: GWxTD domain-containing protein [candidate division Zixibacteria bacterium]|nr:GWxTD domain-containing protein [candidate division Zixibacteria bacterium]
MSNLLCAKVIVFLGLMMILSAQGINAQKSLGLSIDAACFPEEGDTLETLLEVYYTLPRSQLKFVPSGERYEAAMDITLRLDTVAGDSVDQISWQGKTSVEDLQELNRKEYKFFDTVPAFVRPGDYVLTVAVEDVNSGLNAKVRERITVPDYTDPGLKLSQIQLAYSLNPDTVDIPSVKDGVLVIPNASGVFVPENNFIYFYTEVQGMQFDSEDPGKFEVSVAALDATGKTFMQFYSAEYDKPGSSAVISNGVNAFALPDGKYQLKISVADFDAGKKVTSIKPFIIKHSEYYAMNPLMRALFQSHPEAERIDSEEDAELVRKQISHIASGRELKIYDSLNLEGKNNFIKDFWEERDPTPNNELNEFQVQHYARWDYANASFARRSYQKGWATDKGRIFIMYGPPAETDDYRFEVDTVPFEIWRYYNIPDQPGEKIFVFVDEQGHGDFRLFHSNAKDEPYVDNWQEKLQANKVFR